MTSDTTEAVPRMGAETGYELDDQARAPIRITGFLCLVFGLLSVLCLLGRPLLVLPVLAMFFGLVALRPAGDWKPLGTTPAKIGLVLAVGFGVSGFMLPWMKSQTLGSQAAYFAREYLELIARDEAEMAMELRRDYVNRHLDSTPLNLYYQRNERANEALQEFQDDEAYRAIRRAGVDANWQLERPVRVFHQYGRDKADTRWIDAGGQTGEPIQVVLEYRVDPDTGDGQWHVDRCQVHREVIIAESVL